MNWSEINRREVATKAIAGLCGGILGWIPTELYYTFHPSSDLRSGTTAYYFYYICLAFLPAFIGTCINASQLQSLTLTPKARRTLLATFAICFILGFPSCYYATQLFNALLHHQRVTESIKLMIIPRSMAWALLGLLIGVGIGAATFSIPNMIKGAVGGLLGGFVGGLLFDPIGVSFSLVLARAFGFGETGLMIGLLIGLVQDLTKTAWLTVEAGRLRNREFRLEKPLTALGRAEECDVGLFGDTAVEGRHAQIERRGDDFLLSSLGHPVRVNGSPVSNSRLNNGDRIEIGNYALRFNLKSVPVSAATPAVLPAAVAVSKAPGAPCLIDASGRQFNLRPDSSTSLGRSQDNDVVLSDKSISRRHATITPSNGGFYLRDLNSQNGTYVGSQRVDEHLLRDGDQIGLGDLGFTFRA